MLLIMLTALSLGFSLGLCSVLGHWPWLLPLSFVGAFLVLTGLGFLFLLYLCKRVDQDVPQEEDDKLYRFVTDLVIGGALPFLRIHVKKKGLEKVPQTGRFLLVCNHVNNSDPIILLYCLAKSQLAFISKKENRDMFIIGPMMHKIQCQLLDRDNDRQALKVILKCIQILKEDKASVAVFPEGGIAKDKKFHHFRPGVFKIAQKAKVPILVCTLKGTRDVVHNILHFKPSYTELNVLELIPPEEFEGITTVEIADRCYRLMAADLGPENCAED